MQWKHPRGVLLLAGALLALSGPFGGPAAAVPAEPPTAAAPAADDGPAPIDFAVVVDQSKSLADKDLARETEAAALIAQGEISPRSRVTVIGFGSSEKPGQSPVSDVCALTVVDAAGRQKLSDCVQQLDRRDSARTGPGTDFPAAIRQAVARLTEDTATGDPKAPKTPKVVFLLTDGKLDVGDSPEYGTDPASRQANGAKRLDEELARARAAGVQIWPLGFGSRIDEAALKAMAEGGYRSACSDVPNSQPRMRVVGSSAQIDKVLQETFAAARCARVEEGTAGKPPADLYVTIPPIATDGSLTVSKHDPKVRVTYFDPDDRPVPTHGDFDGSSFEVSGQDGPVEALRVKNPLPGRWRVHVEAPEGHRDREVAVRAIWQGRLRSSVLLDPASPRRGQATVVEVQMQTRRGVLIRDPKQLQGVTVSAEVSGEGFAPVTVRLADDGQAPDRTAGDVRFTGTLTLPETATGKLEVVTRMSAPGITSDEVPLHAFRSPDSPTITAGLSVEQTTVHPGDTVHGVLDVTNDDDVAHTLRLALVDGSEGADGSGEPGRATPGGAGLTISPAKVEAPPNRRTRVEFTITVGAGAPLGELGGQVAVVDTAGGDLKLDTSRLGVTVEAPPTWWERWWPYVTTAAALLVLATAFVAVRLAARRRRRDLSGMRLELRRDGTVLDTLTIRAGQSGGGEYLFTVEEPRGSAPTLRRARSGDAAVAHRLRRTGSGELLLRVNREREAPVRPGEPVGVEDCELVVQGGPATDRVGRARATGTTRTRTRHRTGTGTASAADPGADITAGDSALRRRFRARRADTGMTGQPQPPRDTDTGTSTGGNWDVDTDF
ncbi:VWA domain-containing protein [Streptomyces sp. NPDC085481]|uniref:VWA domain-containing protein n=1 Tax=Streptomyces sp. NPDC085481 TaxID=3365727 RepID=UPI0037CEC518